MFLFFLSPALFGFLKVADPAEAKKPSGGKRPFVWLGSVNGETILLK